MVPIGLVVDSEWAKQPDFSSFYRIRCMQFCVEVALPKGIWRQYFSLYRKPVLFSVRSEVVLEEHEGSG